MKVIKSHEEQPMYEPMTQPELGHLIKENRKAKKMSQRQLGEQLGISYQTIANWENGLRVPIPVDLMRLAQALDKPEEFFFCCIPRHSPKQSALTLSENLRNYRKAFGISQVQLSEKTGISLVKIKAYEDETSSLFVTDKNLEKLCGVFKAKPEDLLGCSITAETMEAGVRKNYLQKIAEDLERLNLLGVQKVAEYTKTITGRSRYQK